MGSQPVPEAVQEDVTSNGSERTPTGQRKYAQQYTVEVDDIHEFAKKHGPIQLHAPTEKTPLWTIFVNGGKSGWGQR